MDVRTAVKQLGQTINLSLSISPTDSCRLIFNETLIVDLDWPDANRNRIVLSCGVGLVPADRKLEAYEMLLSANVFGRDTGDATLGVELDHGEVVLHRALTLDSMEFVAFTTALEDFIAQARAWTDRLDTLKLSSLLSSDEPAYSPDFIRA